MSHEALAELLGHLRGVVRDFFAVAIDFMEAVSSKCKCESFNEFATCLKLWNDVVYESFLFVRDYLQVVYETRVFMLRLSSILNFSPPSSDRPPYLAVNFDYAKHFLKNLFEEEFPKFDEQVNVVWGRMLKLSSMVAPLDRDTAARLKGLTEGEIRRWVGEGSAVIDAYRRALEADCEESFVKEVLKLMSGPRLLLDGLRRIASTFAASFDPASHPLESLSEAVQSAKAAAPVVLRGLEARFTVYSYWANTLFHILRALHGYNEASKLLNQVLAGLSRGEKPILSIPENVNLEELRVSFIIARANFEDSIRELPHLKLMLEKVSSFLDFFKTPFLREFCRNERELIDYVTRSINQALALAKDANFKIYRAMEELKRIKERRLTSPDK